MKSEIRERLLIIAIIALTFSGAVNGNLYLPVSGGTVDDTAYDPITWNGDTENAPSKNAARDKIELLAPLASPNFTTSVNLAAGGSYQYNSYPVITANTTLGNYFFGHSGRLAATGNVTTAVGSGALSYLTTGNGNTAVGAWSLLSNTTGWDNTAMGLSSLYYNTTGMENVAIGAAALQNNISGQWNVGLGVEALQYNTTGSANVAAGVLAAANNSSGGGNIALGLFALRNNTTGSYNIAIGVASLPDLIIAASDGSGNNIAIGHNTGGGIVTGINNTIIGANVTGLPANLSNNIIIADGAGNQRVTADGTGEVKVPGNLTVSGITTVILPTSSAGLASGTLWNNAGTPAIVP